MLQRTFVDLDNKTKPWGWISGGDRLEFPSAGDPQKGQGLNSLGPFPFCGI
jgi:hypothetical protein